MEDRSCALGRTSGQDIRRHPDAQPSHRHVWQAAKHQGRQWQSIYVDRIRPMGVCKWRRLDISLPGKPTDNAFIESFNARVRIECLNQLWFLDLDDARTKIESWREDCNHVRPHSAIGERTPNRAGSSQLNWPKSPKRSINRRTLRRFVQASQCRPANARNGLSNAVSTLWPGRSRTDRHSSDHGMNVGSFGLPIPLSRRTLRSATPMRIHLQRATTH